MVFQELWRINDDNLADRAPSRLARRGAAPQGGGGDGGGPAARRGRHLLARSRHRLGRCRSRGQCRRAQGREPADAAHRPRQPPARRAVGRGARSGQPLRGAGMPRGDRGGRRERPGHAAPRAPARSTCWRSTCSAAPAAAPFLPDELYAEVRRAAPYARSRARRFRRGGRFRRHRRLRAARLRAFRQDPARPRRALARRPSAHRPAVPAQRRHHRRSRHAEGAAGARARRSPRRHRPDRARRPHPRRGRGIFHRAARARQHLRLRRRGAALRGAGRGRGLCLAHQRRGGADSLLRGRQVSALDLSRRARARADRRAARVGETARPGARVARHPAVALAPARGATACWSRPFRAPTSPISSAIRSKAASRTRRSACC